MNGVNVAVLHAPRAGKGQFMHKDVTYTHSTIAVTRYKVRARATMMCVGNSTYIGGAVSVSLRPSASGNAWGHTVERVNSESVAHYKSQSRSGVGPVQNLNRGLSCLLAGSILDPLELL